MPHRRRIPLVLSLLLAVVLVAPRPASACTLWALNGEAAAGGGSILVKNRDYPPGHPTSFALVNPTAGYRVLAMLSTVGGKATMVGGVNEKGLAVVTATVGTMPRVERARRRVAAGLVSAARPLLTRFATVREVVAARERLAGFAPVFALIADADEVAVFESSGTDFAVAVLPRNGSAAHTNHPLLAGVQDLRQEPDPAGSLTRLARVRELLGALAKPADLEAAAALARDRADGPDRSIFRTGSTPRKARTVGGLAAWLPPDGGTPRVLARVVDPLGGREVEVRYRLDAAFWEAAPPRGQARTLLQ